MLQSIARSIWICTKQTVQQTISKIPWLLPSVLSTAVVIGYIVCHPVMIDQSTQYRAHISNITLNFALFLFFYGVVMERVTKKMTKWKGWVLWGIGLFLLLLFFRFVGGYTTIFG